MKTILSIATVLLFCHAAWSATGVETKMEYFLEGGILLPDQIDEVTEVLPTWGLGVGWVKDTTVYGFELANATSEGVQFFNLAASIRADLEIMGLTGTVAGGLDATGLERPGHEGRKYFGGAHFSGGVMALISKGLYARMNMKFNLNPGVSMFLGFGLLYRPAEDF